MEPKMTISFIGKKARATKHNLLPLYLRVIIEGKRFEVATHQHVKFTEWANASGRVKGRSDSAITVNMALDELRRKVYELRDRILVERRNFTVSTLREKWFGTDRNKLTLLGVFRLSIIDLEKLAGKGIYRKSTLTKYKSTEKHLVEFLKWRNNGVDVLLVDLRMEFAGHFQYYLQAEKGLSINSSGKDIKNLKKVIRDCVDKDWLDRDPFFRYKVKHIDPKVPHLSAEELKAIQEKEITIPRLDLVRDIFLFSCYTGFAYVDVANLAREHLKIGIDGKKWLIKDRQKTEISERVPVLPPVVAILNKYEEQMLKTNTRKLLPVLSNQKVNAYLKELADICGINHKVTFHMARHTFATTVTLENGVPIDSVSRMLGHRSIKTTQIYAQITDKKISDDTLTLYEKLATI